jgi:ketosteroid isomerase-like protein
MRKLLFVVLLLAGPRLSAQRSASPDTEQVRILTLENAWNQAVQQKDADALKILLAPDLTYVDYDGTLMDKAEYLASVQSPSLEPVRIVNESTNVHLYGTVAVVNGVCRENGVKNRKPYTLRERFTDTWVRRGDNWVCVASESTLIPH